MGEKAIIFCAGGTAGHAFPAAALAQEVKQKHQKIFLISDARGLKYSHDVYDKIYKLPISRLGAMFFLKSPYLLAKSLALVWNAEKVICFGGYTTLFPFLAACILRKERIIYQLDSHVTRLNRMLIPLASRVFYGFAQTNLRNKKNTYCFGIPVRNGFEFSFIQKQDSLNVSIIGGSLGSAYWKPLLTAALDLLPAEIRKIMHLKIQTSESVDFLKKFNVGSIETSPFYDTAKLFRDSHLIIARAGATSIAEISSVARAAYLVPWENAIENHQYKNAKNYSNFNAAKFGNNPQELAEYITKIAESNDFFYQVCQNAAEALPQFAKNKASAAIMTSVR